MKKQKPIDQQATSTTATVEIDRIRAAKSNVHARESRRSATMEGLVASIRANGLIHRIVVRPDADGYTVIDGHRRLEAAKIAGLETVPVEIRPVDEEDAIALTVTANVQRLENDPILEAEAIERLIAAHLDISTIAAKLGKDAGYVARRARLINLTPPWREFAKRAKCTVDLLERVAAHEQRLQIEVANDAGIEKYQVDDGDRVVWQEFAGMFETRLRRLDEAIFDAKQLCAKCPANTNGHNYLFDFMGREERGWCQDAACFAKHHEAVIEERLERLRREGTPAVEITERWRVPKYWMATESKPKTGDVVQAYVFREHGLRYILWSEPQQTKPEPTPGEKEQRRAEMARVKTMKSARSKIREAVDAATVGGRNGYEFFARGNADAYRRIAEKRLDRDLGRYIDDVLCDDIMAEMGDELERSGILNGDEAAVYREVIQPGD